MSDLVAVWLPCEVADRFASDRQTEPDDIFDADERLLHEAAHQALEAESVVMEGRLESVSAGLGTMSLKIVNVNPRHDTPLGPVLIAIQKVGNDG